MTEDNENPELNNYPALRINHVVRGRERRNNRVFYIKEPDVSEGVKAIPEQIVLYRWRKQEINSGTCHGFRLSPNIWRSIGIALGKDANAIKALIKDEIVCKYNDLSSLIAKIISHLQALKIFQICSKP